MNPLNSRFSLSPKSDHGLVRLSIPIVAVVALLLFGQSAFAARLVRFSISLDGKVVLSTSTGDSGRQDADAVWDYLKRLDLHRVNGYTVEPNIDNPLQATLKGKVIVQSVYAGRAVLSELRLARETEDDPWKLPAAEVDRTFESRSKPFQFYVRIGGKTALYSVSEIGTAGTPEDADMVWQHLKTVELLPINRYKMEPDVEDTLRATLNGNVTMEAFYGGQRLGHAEVSELRLVRKNDKAWKWKVVPTEVERTRKVRKD